MKDSDRVLHMYLVEQNLITEKEFTSLTEETKMETIKNIAQSILQNVKEKIEKIDLAAIDKSKGDIKTYKDYPAISEALNNLEAILDRAYTQNVEQINSIKTIMKSILYLNQYSAQFKDAYRNKKTLMILKYQSLVLSIISATAYVISTFIKFEDNNVSLNPNPRFEKIAPISTLETFNNSIESGEFRLVLRDVQVVRESYDENIDGAALNEDILSTMDSVITSVKGYVSNLDKSGKLMTLLYKAAAVVVLLLSLRETFYSMSNMRTKVSDIVESIKNFANIGSGTSGIVEKLGKFADNFKIDSEFGTEMAQREIEHEDRVVANNMTPGILKQQISQYTTEPEAPAKVSDFFNF